MTRKVFWVFEFLDEWLLRGGREFFRCAGASDVLLLISEFDYHRRNEKVLD